MTRRTFEPFIGFSGPWHFGRLPTIQLSGPGMATGLFFPLFFSPRLFGFQPRRADSRVTGGRRIPAQGWVLSGGGIQPAPVFRRGAPECGWGGTGKGGARNLNRFGFGHGDYCAGFRLILPRFSTLHVWNRNTGKNPSSGRKQGRGLVRPVASIRFLAGEAFQGGREHTQADPQPGESA